MTTETNKIALNTSFQVIVRIIQLILSAATVIILTRYLGPTEYGFYALILAFIGLFSDISGFGINLVIARKMPTQPTRQENIFANALSLKITLSIIIFGLAVLFGILIYPEAKLHWGLALAGLSAFFMAAQIVYQAIFQVKLKIYNFAIADVASRVIGFSILMYFVYQGFGITAIIATFTISSFLNWLLTDYYARKIFPIKFSINWDSWKKLMIEALPLAGFIILAGFGQKIGIIILSKLQTTDAVGIYQIAFQPVFIVYGISLMFIGFIYPLMAKYRLDAPKKFKLLLNQSENLLFSFSFYLVLFIAIFRDHIISILGGEQYIGASLPLLILFGFLFVRLIILPIQTAVLVSKQEKQVSLSYLLGLITVIILSFLLIPIYSQAGAAMALLGGELVIFTSILIAGFSFAKKIDWLRIIWRSVPIGIITFIAFWFIGQHPNLDYQVFKDYSIMARIGIIIITFIAFFSPVIYQYRARIRQALSWKKIKRN